MNKDVQETHKAAILNIMGCIIPLIPKTRTESVLLLKGNETLKETTLSAVGDINSRESCRDSIHQQETQKSRCEI